MDKFNDFFWVLCSDSSRNDLIQLFRALSTRFIVGIVIFSFLWHWLALIIYSYVYFQYVFHLCSCVTSFIKLIWHSMSNIFLREFQIAIAVSIYRSIRTEQITDDRDEYHCFKLSSKKNWITYEVTLNTSFPICQKKEKRNWDHFRKYQKKIEERVEPHGNCFEGKTLSAVIFV